MFMTWSLTRVNPPSTGAVRITDAECRQTGVDESPFLWGDSGTDASIDLVTEIYGLGSSILRKHRRKTNQILVTIMFGCGEFHL